ncbi:MAG: LemA family protein [Endomicrobiales bacterium]
MDVALLVMILLGLVAAGILLYFAGIYNQLVHVRVNIDRSWSNIEVLLKQRYDEIPNLVRVCEGYLAYEREVLERITSLRTRCLEARTPGRIAKVDSELELALRSLFAVSEKYPDLKANESFVRLQGRVSSLETQIADRREFYNESVAIFNVRVRQIPEALVASLLKYAEKEMYKVPENEKAVPDIRAGLTQAPPAGR